MRPINPKIRILECLPTRQVGSVGSALQAFDIRLKVDGATCSLPCCMTSNAARRMLALPVD